MADRKLLVRIIGDDESLRRAFTRSSRAANESANAQIQASVRKTAHLRKEIGEFQAVAASSRRGSQEQVAAAHLAAQAQRQLASSIGVSARESRSLRAASRGFDRDIGRATRGALAGSGVFRGLGRSIAFASGGFLAFASAGQFLRTSIDAAKEAAVTQAQLAAQFRASGQALAPYQKQIDETANRLSLLAGFQNDELKAGFVTIFRTTGNVTKSLRDLGTAADLARAKHISFAQASLIVAKTEAGNTTLLRRQGIQIAKNATAEQALATLRRVVAGQAKAGTTQQERFGAVLHNTEEIIGTGLLPTLNKYLARAAVWLTQMNDSGRLQKDVSRITKDFGRVLHDIGAIAQFVSSGLRRLNKVTGDTEHSLLVGAGALLLFKNRSILMGAAAATAAGEAAGLRGALLGLTGLNPIVIPITLLLSTKQGRSIAHENASNLQKVLGDALPTSGSKAKKLGSDLAHLLFGGIKADSPAGRLFGLKDSDPSPTFHGRPKFPFPAFEPTRPPSKGSTSDPRRRPLSLQGQFNIAELRLARASLTKSLADDRAILTVEAGITRQQIEHTKTLKDRTALTQKLSGILGQILNIDQADVGVGKKSAAHAKQSRSDAQQKLRDALQTKQFKALGLDASGSELTPGVKALKREFSRVGDAFKGTFLDTSKTTSLMARIRKVLSGGFGAVTKDVRAKIKEMLDGIDQELKDHSEGAQTKFVKASLKKLTDGLGLDPATRKALEGRLSQLGPGGTVPGHGVGAFGVALNGDGTVIHTHVHLDGREVAKSVTKHQSLKRRQNSRQRDGLASSR